MWFRWSTVLKAPESENMSVNCLTRCEPCNRPVTCPGCILNPDMKYKSLGGFSLSSSLSSPLRSLAFNHAFLALCVCLCECCAASFLLVCPVLLPGLRGWEEVVWPRFYWSDDSGRFHTFHTKCVYNVTVLLIFVCAACPLPGLRGGLPPP